MYVADRFQKSYYVSEFAPESTYTPPAEKQLPLAVSFCLLMAFSAACWAGIYYLVKLI